MTRRMMCAALAGVALTMIVSQAAQAGDIFYSDKGYNGGPGMTAPVMNAGLYPMPVQTVPRRMGGTYITNPAFYPHEYLYAHEHHYLAPPFYYKHKTGPFGLPGKHLRNRCNDECGEDVCPRCGMSGCKGHCKLKGTEIIVKYKRKRSIFKTLFLPPH